MALGVWCTFVLMAVILGILVHGDLENTFYNKNKAFRFHEPKVQWTTSKRNCELNGGNLVTITDKDTQQFLEEIFNKNIPKSRVFFIGAYMNFPGNWSWVTGLPVHYSNWASRPHGKYALYSLYTKTKHKWLTMRSSNYYGSYICQYDCYRGEQYEFVATKLTRTEAQTACHNKNSTLLIIPDRSTLGYIKKTVKKLKWPDRDLMFVHVGAKKIETEWMWTNGLAVTYPNMVKGMGTRRQTNAVLSLQDFSLDTCDENERHPYICVNDNSLNCIDSQSIGTTTDGLTTDENDSRSLGITDEINSHVCTTSTTTVQSVPESFACPSPVDMWLHNRTYYHLIRNKTYWIKAHFQCFSKGGHLLTIIHHDIQTFLKDKLLSIKWDDTKENDLLIFTGALKKPGGWWKWSDTGDNVTYNNWQENELHDADYAMVAMLNITSRDMTWVKRGTGFIAFVICQYDVKDQETLSRCPGLDNTFLYKDRIFRVFTDKQTWNDSQLHCISFGGHLVTVPDGDTQMFLVNILKTIPVIMKLVWIGARRESEWTWESDDDFKFHLWDSDESDHDGSALCGAMYTNDCKWSPKSCDSIVLPYICQSDAVVVERQDHEKTLHNETTDNSVRDLEGNNPNSNVVGLWTGTIIGGAVLVAAALTVFVVIRRRARLLPNETRENSGDNTASEDRGEANQRRLVPNETRANSGDNTASEDRGETNQYEEISPFVDTTIIGEANQYDVLSPYSDTTNIYTDLNTNIYENEIPLQQMS